MEVWGKSPLTTCQESFARVLGKKQVTVKKFLLKKAANQKSQFPQCVSVCKSIIFQQQLSLPGSKKGSQKRQEMCRVVPSKCAGWDTDQVNHFHLSRIGSQTSQAVFELKTKH